MINLKGAKPIRTQWERKKSTDSVKDGYTELSRSGWYNSSRWKKVREYVFKKTPLCRECARQGRAVVAYAIDHIIPIDEDSSDELKYGLDNLQPLCKFHHRQKTTLDKIEKAKALKREKGKLLMGDLEDW